MSFFQNPFEEYRGVWALGDYKGYSLTFKVPYNKNKGDVFIAWNVEPYDFSSSGILTFNFAFDPSFKNYSAFSIDVTGAVPSATLASEVCNILNANATFSEYYTAYLDNAASGGGLKKGGPFRLYIRQAKQNTAFRTYITNGGAEASLLFNKFAGVADIPSYFDRDSIANRFETPEANSNLIRLSHTISGNTTASASVITTALPHGLSSGNTVYIVGSNSSPSINGSHVATVISSTTFSVPITVTTAGTTGEFLSAVEYQVVTNAGVDYTTMLADWQHLQGRTSSYMFYSNVVDGSDRITSQIEWQAGAVAGQLAKKKFFTYSGSQTTPLTTIEIPYILAANDLITP